VEKRITVMTCLSFLECQNKCCDISAVKLPTDASLVKWACQEHFWDF